MKQNCSYQGESLNVPTAFYGQWSSNNMKKMNGEKFKKVFFLIRKFVTIIPAHAFYKIQSDRFSS